MIALLIAVSLALCFLPLYYVRRRNRKWVALAVSLYLGLMYAAYRWSIAQWPADGNILSHIEREEVRKYKERVAREAEEAARLEPHTAESRLNAAPALVAARYDATHVVFIVITDAASRFSASPLGSSGGKPTRIAAADHPAAPLASLDELYEPDSQALNFLPDVVRKTEPGDPWILDADAHSTIPVVVERTIVAPAGCSLALGFLASVPPASQPAFAAISDDYFLVRHAAVPPANPPIVSQIGELAEWKTSPEFAQQIEQQLNERMKQEVAAIDARLVGNARSPGATASELPIGNARPRLKEWLQADQGLARGEGALDYDLHAYRLTPDGLPRLFVRARWILNDTPVFVMTAWFKADWPKAEFRKAKSASGSEPAAEERSVLLWADASWALAMREGTAPTSLGDRLDFQTVLNEFDADSDGWAELLIYSDDIQPNDPSTTPPRFVPGPSASIAPYIYTDKGLVPLATPLHRDLRTADACLDP